MAIAFLIGIPDSFSATRDLVAFVSPLGTQPIHVAFWLLGVGAIYTTIVQGIRIRRLEKGPKITVNATVYENQEAVLEVHNDGVGADFTIMGKIVEGIANPGIYEIARCHINKGGTHPILVAKVAETTQQTNNILTTIFAGGIVLCQDGKEKFGATTLEILETASLNKRYPSMRGQNITYKDACIIEVSITSEPALIKPVVSRYAIEIDHKNRNTLLFSSALMPDKEGSQS